MFTVRKLVHADITKSYIELLNQLRPSPVDSCPVEHFRKLFEEMLAKGTTIFVAVEEKSRRIVGSVSVLLEQKLIRGGAKAAHIEDVVVDRSHRRQGLAKRLLERSIDFAKKNHCYKITLHCDISIKHVYESVGFETSGIEMKMYLRGR